MKGSPPGTKDWTEGASSTKLVTIVLSCFMSVETCAALKVVLLLVWTSMTSRFEMAPLFLLLFIYSSFIIAFGVAMLEFLYFSLDDF